MISSTSVKQKLPKLIRLKIWLDKTCFPFNKDQNRLGKWNLTLALAQLVFPFFILFLHKLEKRNESNDFLCKKLLKYLLCKDIGISSLKYAFFSGNLAQYFVHCCRTGQEMPSDYLRFIIAVIADEIIFLYLEV